MRDVYKRQGIKVTSPTETEGLRTVKKDLGHCFYRSQKSGGNGMNQEMEFKNIVAQYSKVKPEEMTGEMRSVSYTHLS